MAVPPSYIRLGQLIDEAEEAARSVVPICPHDSLSVFCIGLGVPLADRLNRHGFGTVRDLRVATDGELMRVTFFSQDDLVDVRGALEDLCPPVCWGRAPAAN